MEQDHFSCPFRPQIDSRDLWLLPLSGDALPRAILGSQFEEQYPQVSPDGHWIVCASNATGAHEVYVRPMTPGGRPEEAQRLSTNGGVQPRWRQDGQELFYVAAPIGASDGELMPVSVKPVGSTFEFGEAVPSVQGADARESIGARVQRLARWRTIPRRRH